MSQDASTSTLITNAGPSSSGGDGSKIDVKGKGKEKKPTLDPKIDFLAGTIAGATGLIVGQPFDTIKVRFQSPQFAGRYTSTWGALSAMVRDEKIKGLFRGVTSPMAGIAFTNGVIFTSYATLMKWQVKGDRNGLEGEDDGEGTLGQMALAGAGAGVVGSLLTTPIELIKIRQQSSPTHTFPSTLTVIRDILRKEGFFGLYRGFRVTAMREVAYGPYFVTYEGLCRYFRSRRSSVPTPSESSLASTSSRSSPPEISRHSPESPYYHHHEPLIKEAELDNAELSWAELMFAGGCAGSVAWAVTIPLDVLKTRLQNAQAHVSIAGSPAAAIGSEIRKRGPTMWTVAADVYRQEGPRGFFAGLAPTLIRAFPVNMVIFLCFEAVVAGMQ